MNKQLLIAVFSIMVIALGCNKNDDSEQREMERRILDLYLERNNITVEPTESGLYYIPLEEGNGDSPVESEWVEINYSLSLISEEDMIFSTWESKAEENFIYNERILYTPVRLMVGDNIEGLDEALTMMKEGGRAKLIVPSDLAYGSAQAGAIPPYSSLLVEVKLNSVIIDINAFEQNKIDNYLNDNEYNVDSAESGIYYIEISEGQGDSASMSNYVTIDFRGSLLNGPRFVSNELKRFIPGGINTSDITAGLSEGASYMKEGGRAKIIVPYHMAYGFYGKSRDDGHTKVPVPAFSTILYDVHLLDVE